MDIFRILGPLLVLVTAILDFSGEANTCIHGLREDDTVTRSYRVIIIQYMVTFLQCIAYIALLVHTCTCTYIYDYIPARNPL